MAVQQFTFPQSGDADDAEHFASMIGQGNLTNYVETGLGFSYDNAVPEVTVAEGKGYIRLASDVASSSGEDILEVNHVVQVPQQTVALTDSALNYLYLEPNFGTDDNGDVSAYTSQQGGNVLLIGTIDTTSDEVTESNRNPEITSRRFGLEDDSNLEFGTGDDFIWYYDSGEDRLALDNDASTRLADVGDTDWQMEVDLSLNGNNLDSVSSIDGGGTKIQFDDKVDLTGVGVEYDLNAGVQELVDMEVGSGSPGGTEHSYDFKVDNTTILKVYAESDGAGSIQNTAVDVTADLDLNGNNLDDVSSVDGGGTAITFADAIDVPADSLDATEVDIARGLEDDGAGAIQFDEDESYTFTNSITFNAGLDAQGDITDGAQVIWDVSAQEIPDSAMGSIDNATLTNSSVTVTAGDGLKNGGAVALGASTTLDIEPADFAGAFLADDGADNLEVLIGRGLENDGSGNIQFDEDTAYTFTAAQTIQGLLTLQGGIDLEGTGANTTVTLDDTFDLVFEDDANANIFTVLEAGGVSVDSGSLNMSASGSIQDAGSNAITFDGSQNVTLPGSTTLTGGGTLGANLDFAQNQAMNFVVENRTSDPGSAVTGQLWYRTDLD